MKLYRRLLTFACLVQISSADAALLNRWSFNNAAGAAASGTTMTDSVSSVVMDVRGNGATFTGTALTLPGTTTGKFSDANISAYCNLTNGLVSAKTNLTVELWATVVASKTQQRFFSFGNTTAGDGLGAAGEWTGATAPGATTANDDLMLSAQNGSTLANFPYSDARYNTGTEYKVIGTAALAAATEYHLALTFTDGAGSFGSSGGQVAWYRNAVLVGTVDVPFHLYQLRDVNNWLGRSQWAGDTMANISYNEFRIYNHAMSVTEVTNSFLAGPNPAAPTAQPDSAAINYAHKVRLPVLANDSGNIFSSSIVIMTPPQYGSATPDGTGQILYTHTNGTPASDSFTYRVSGAGGTSTPATVTIYFSNNLRLTNNTLNVPSTPPPTSYQLVNAFPSVTFSQPLCLATPPVETNRLFVCEKGGLLKVITNMAAANVTASVFLDLPALLTSRGEAISTGGEQGLLGLAFHPGYATNGYLYVYYSVTTNGVTYERLSRFTVSAGNSNAVNTASELILFSQPDTASNHNGGDLHFGPDGYLYISLGDGGDQNDTQNHAQKIDGGFYSGIARLDVDKTPGSLAPNLHSTVPLYSGAAAYAIPPGNPYIGATSFNGSAVSSSSVYTELWAVGLRNPWRFSIDFVTSNLWCGNVGQDLYEAVYIITNKQNCGWSFYEQNHNGPKIGSVPGGFTYTHPIFEYPHGSGNFAGNSVTGGVVYRGSKISSLVGSYICGDYVSGNVWALIVTNGTLVSSNRITGQANIVAFGTDPSNGDVLAANISSGQILRLSAGTPSGSYPANLSDTGVFADLTDLSPSPGVVNYTPNLAFWSDYAVKSRWFIIPDATNQMTWSRDGVWTFPTNEIWVKHFDMEMERGNPATKQRIETRLLVRNSGGVYGVSYQWNANQTDAALVPDSGADFDLNITDSGTNYTQHWHIPSRAECLACHNPPAGLALSFNTRQINRTNTMSHLSGNQLDLLNAAGYFANAPEPVNTLPRHVAPGDTGVPLETRVRSYLAVNCAYCHQPGGTGGGTWDGRPQTPLYSAGIINGSAVNNGGSSANKYVVPNDTLHSIILNRIAVTNGFTRMPPLASSELDRTNIALVTQWIQSFDTNRMAFGDWQVFNFSSTNATNAQAGTDPDGDGRNNFLEYLYGTSPLLAETNYQNPGLTLSPSGMATISYLLSPNAVAQVQAGTNLFNWSLWNVPGNDGLPASGSLQSIQGQTTNSTMFFRLLLNQR